MKLALPRMHFTPAVTRLVAAVLGMIVLALAGARVSRAGFERRAALREARATLATFADWRSRYRPAIAAESIAWRRAWMEVRDLGVLGDERLAITQHVARSAEFAGLRNVRVLIEAPDSTGSDARLSTPEVRRRTASFGLAVECRGSLQSVLAFLGALPPSVAATSMNLVRQEGNARHRLTLAVYELDIQNASSPAPVASLDPVSRAPVERGDTRSRRGDRAGS
jgi:hypothetical protein